jgi:DNA-binding transcriptional regulator PaaX
MSYKEKFSESIVDLIMATLGSGRSTRRFYSILSERKLKRHNHGSIRVTLSRLSKKGYISNSRTGWSLTEKGKSYIKEEKLLSYIPSPFAKNSPQNTIVSFDVPEHSRVMRDWLRNQIKIFGYTMLQQSLWAGPGPLPKEFMKRLDDLKIRQNIKTFRIKSMR